MKKFYLLLSLLFLSTTINAQNPDAFIMTFEVSDDTGLNITIPINLYYLTAYNIDFGDGTVLTNHYGHSAHTYNTSGQYTITITGNINISFDSHVNAYKLKTVEQWGSNEWKSMEAAFKGCSNLLINATDSPDLSQVTNMEEAFAYATSLNQSINNWDVSNVTNMKRVFYNATSFNQPLNNWNVSNVTNMNEMFAYAPAFNQPLNSWNVSNVTDMSLMFYTQYSNVTSFNQPLDNWDISSVIHLNGMLNNAYNFNQDLSSWDFSNVNSLDFIDKSGLDYFNYDKLLQRFMDLGIQGQSLNVNGLKYCNKEIRKYLEYNHFIGLSGDSIADECNGNIIKGSIYYDELANDCGSFLATSPFNDALITANNGNVNYSTVLNYGLYSLNLLEGEYTVSVPNIPDYFSLNSDFFVNFSGFGDEIINSFCLTANQTANDLNIVIVPTSQAQSGSETSYRIIVQNLGTQLQQDILVNLTFDNTKQSFIHAMLGNTSASPNVLASSFTFEISGISPFGKEIIYFSLLNSQNLNEGDILELNATVTPDTSDYTPEDNIFELNQMIINSVIPTNNKQILQGNKIHIDKVDEYLYFLINYENVENFTMSHVKIKDILHETLDWKTFQMVNRHPHCEVEIRNNNQVEFTFDNNYFDEGEKGFVVYKIKPKEGLQIGDAIVGNEVYIYNNYNFLSPIITNATLTEIYNDNSIVGNIIYDENNDGCSLNDVEVNNTLITASDGNSNFSTLSKEGQYSLNVFEETYTIGLFNLPNYFSYTPVSSTIDFNGTGNSETLNFCLTSNQSIQDLNITLLPITEARPGFEADYQLIVQNVGTQTMNNVLVTLTFDDTMQSFISANPTESSATTNQLNFEIASLSPFSSSIIDFTMETFTPPTVNGDNILNFTATVTPNTDDYTPNDNTFELAQIVVNSYDPNDKLVLQGNEIHIDNVNEYLHYIVRFQNTGTASAINVRIEDTLHESLDWNTIQILNSSHNYRVEIKDGNQMEFIFNNIYLPYEDEDEEGSNGFIAYKIKPIAGLEIGDIITGNEAYIYFDYNEPIITNTTSTEVVEETSSVSIHKLNDLISVYPNPTNGIVHISSKENITIEEVKIYNLQGRELLGSTTNQETINIENLSSGMYLMNIKTNQGTINKRVIKK